MKKLLIMLLAIATTSLTVSAQSRRNNVDGNEDTSANRTMTNTIDRKILGGSSTTQIITTKDADGNAITLIPLNKGTRFVGWHVIVAKDGEVLLNKNYTKKRFVDSDVAIAQAKRDIYGGGNVSGTGSTVRDIVRYSQGQGTFRGYRRPF